MSVGTEEAATPEPHPAVSTTEPTVRSAHLGLRPGFKAGTNAGAAAPPSKTLIQMIIRDVTMIKGGGGAELHLQINGRRSSVVI